MFTDVYIGLIKSKDFDYDIEGDSTGYLPTPAMPRPGIDEHKHFVGERDLFWDILGSPDGKQVDWGCYVIKMSLPSMLAFLAKDKHTKNEFAHYLAARAKELLDPSGDYLLVAMES